MVAQRIAVAQRHARSMRRCIYDCTALGRAATAREGQADG